jgi:hypothetical protein
MVGTDSVSCPIAGLSINVIDHSNSAATVLVLTTFAVISVDT